MRQSNYYFTRLITTTLLFALFFIGANAQSTISGIITDDSDTPLIGATVYIVELGKGVATDINGKYSIDVPPGTYTMEVNYIGFSSTTRQVTADGAQSMSVALGTDNLALDEVVVTGTFSSRSQKESPISMTYLSGVQLQQLAASSQADILRTVPGITAEGGGGEIASNVFVRGMPSGGQYQFTPLQVDGLPVLSTFGLNSSAHDVYFRNDVGIRNLEFVRGGASTLFGAGSVAGIINYTSVTGSNNPKNTVQLEWAQGGRLKTDFLASGPINETTFYAFSGMYRYDNGPLETGLPTRGHQIRGNVKKLFNGGNSSFTVSTQYIDDNVQFYLPYPLANEDGNKERPVGNDGETVYTMLTSQARDFSFDTPNGVFETPIGNGVTTKGGYVMLDLKHSFADSWRLTSKAKAANYDHWFNLFLDGDGRRDADGNPYSKPETQAEYTAFPARNLPADAQFIYADTGQPLAEDDIVFENRVLDRERPMEELVGEINLTKTVGEHNITVGTFMSNTKAQDNNWIWNFLGDFSNSPRMVGVTYTDSLGIDHTFSQNGFISGSQTNNKTLESTKTAVYIADEFKSEKFNFDIGLRWERAAGKLSAEKGIGSNTFEKGEVAASDVAIALAGLYKATDDLNVYANFSRGYFFPELRGVKFSSPGETQTYETEGILQGELGAKYAQKKVSATAALFLVALSDRRSIDFEDDGSGGVTEIVSVQSTRTIGAELSANYNVVPGLDLYGNMTLQDHEFTEVENNPEQVGNKLRRQPNIMGLAGIRYAGNSFDANLSGNFLGSKFANDSNTVELDGFGIVRLDAGYTIPMGDNNESLRLGLSVFNLLDSAGITEGSPRQGNAQEGDSQFFIGRPILPRRIFIRAGFNF